MIYKFTDYVITQSGDDLTIDNPIKIMKYDNKISRIVFKVEDNIKENTRLYCAILNPHTKRYHYEPLLYDDELDGYYLIIGTSISYYVGKPKLLLIAVEPSFILEDNITFDKSVAVYVSKEFARITVVENFLDDVAYEISMPTIDKALDDLVILHDNVIQYSIETAEDLINCNEALAKCNEDLEQCDVDVQSCEEILQSCNNVLRQIQTLQTNFTNDFQAKMNEMQRTYNEYIQSIRNGGMP